MQKVTLFIVLVFLLPLAVIAQGNRFVRYDCTAGSDGDSLVTRDASSSRRKLPGFHTDWLPDKIYRVPVILMEFKDRQFSMENPQATYDSLFNYSGYNLGHGLGCVADYFRDQSGGRFNLKFDVVGPVHLNTSWKLSENNFGSSQLRAAAQMADPLLNYADYDWYSLGEATQVVYIYAGYGGNETDAEEADSCIWPSTSTFTTLRLDNCKVSQYSASAELWTGDRLCGIGTICHEFSHCLGLPDVYPTGGDEFSVLDEWDLMDGGNFTEDGWCPPNYTAHEKELLGWVSPVDLTVTQTVSSLRPVSQGGEVYRIVNDGQSNEYYLLENRQRQGWDYFLPGHGLTVIHVDYDRTNWSNNRVNTLAKHHRYDFIHADNHNYSYYESLLDGVSHFENGRSLYLKDSAYPYVSDKLTVRELTDTSVPAATLFNKNLHGTLLMGRPIVNIEESEEGLVSFQFYESVESSVRTVVYDNEKSQTVYNLHGQRVRSISQPGFYIVGGKKYFAR